jgi:hypothetical protein
MEARKRIAYLTKIEEAVNYKGRQGDRQLTDRIHDELKHSFRRDIVKAASIGDRKTVKRLKDQLMKENRTIYGGFIDAMKNEETPLLGINSKGCYTNFSGTELIPENDVNEIFSRYERVIVHVNTNN